MPKDMVINKQISINKNIGDVFQFLKLIKNQDLFSVWNMKDPNAAKTYSGIDGTKGFVYTWNSNNKSVGAGEQEITNLYENERIDYRLTFIRPMKNTATSSFVLEQADDTHTLVNWTFDSPTKFPMSLFSPIFANMLGKQMNESLQNLKVLLEKDEAVG